MTSFDNSVMGPVFLSSLKVTFVGIEMPFVIQASVM